MNDRVSSMAQLSRWTDSMQQSSSVPAADAKLRADSKAHPPPSAKTSAPPFSASGSADAKKAPAMDEEYDEEFEDYEEDFEEEPSPQKPAFTAPASIARVSEPIVAQAKAVPAFKLEQAPLAREDASSLTHPSIASDAKRVVATEAPPAKSTRPKNMDSIAGSLSRSIADPRLVRIQRLLSSKVMEMNSEKFTLFTMVPTTPYEFYLTALRKPNSSLKQAGVPLDKETREVEINTDDIATQSMAVQACYGDDTTFYALLDDVRQRRSRLNRGGRPEGSGEDAKTVEVDNRHTSRLLGEESLATDDATGRQSSTLSAFLQRASNLCEGILRDESLSQGNKAETKASRGGQHLLDPHADWAPLATDQTKGENELIRTRHTTAVRFSSLQVHMLLAVHPFPLGGEEAENDLRGSKGLLSLWDTVASPGSPTLLLECAGQPSACCFSSTQSHVVVAGSCDGSLYLWDLREPASMHMDKDAQDLKISKGVRKPSFTTHLSLSLALGEDFNEDVQHTAGIVQIESLGGEMQSSDVPSAAVSQFISLDERGAVVFWISSETAYRSGDTENLKRSPWGRIVLTPTKQVATQQLIKSLGASAEVHKSSAAGKSLLWLQTDYSASSLLLPEVICSTVPSDSSLLLVSAWRGDLVKAARIGEAPAPRVLQRPVSGLSSPLCAHITCMSVREAASAERVAGQAPLVLVGREDGTVDLFQLDGMHPLVTWNISAVGGAADTSREVKVILVRWCSVPGSPSTSFLAATDRGMLCWFDLTQDLYHPILVERLQTKGGKLRSMELDISRMRNRTDVCKIAVCNRREASVSLRLRKLNPTAWTAERPNAESVLRECLSHLIAPAMAKSAANVTNSDDKK